MALLPFLRAFPEQPEKVRALVTRSDPAALLEAARLHGLSAWLDHALRASAAPLPEPLATQLSREALGMAGGTLRAKAMLLQTLDTLEAAGIQPVLLKGYALGARLYPEPLLRPTSDVDLLLSQEELPHAAQALRALGLKPMEEAAEAYHREHHHHLTFGGPQGAVELHFRLLTGFDSLLPSEPPLARARRFSLEGRWVRLLAPEDELLFLALHAANHLYARLSWLYDLKLFVQRIPLDWDLLATRAREARLQGPAAITFSLARRLLAVPVPASLDAQLEMSVWHRALERAAFTPERLETADWARHKYAGFALMSAMATAPLGRLRFAGHHTVRGLKRRLAGRFPRYLPARWQG